MPPSCPHNRRCLLQIYEENDATNLEGQRGENKYFSKKTTDVYFLYTEQTHPKRVGEKVL